MLTTQRGWYSITFARSPTMFTRILCPIDFTTFSHHALAQAVAIARVYGANLTGVHVVPERTTASIAGDGWREQPSAFLARLRGQVRKVMLEANAPQPAALAIMGDPALEIEKVAAALPADLVVIPVHGWSGQAAHTCGSVTEQVMCHSSAPVLVVPDAANVPASTSFQGFRRIVCGIDFSPASLKALRYASDLAASAHADLVVTHVLPGTDSGTAVTDHDPASTNETTAMWQRRLHQASHSAASTGVTVRDQLRFGEPSEELLQLVREERGDLLVIGGHRGNPPGCVMHHVIAHASCPVLVVRVSR
jgi:nucleotide-binding universal stress UspA family protein